MTVALKVGFNGYLTPTVGFFWWLLSITSLLPLVGPASLRTLDDDVKYFESFFFSMTAVAADDFALVVVLVFSFPADFPALYLL